MRTLILLFLVACGSSHVEPKQPTKLADIGWWVGDWQGPDGTEHWYEAGGAMFGVWFHGDEFTVMVVDDGQGSGPADGVLRYITIPNGTASTEVKSLDAAGLRQFTHVYSYKHVAPLPADDIAAADRQFSTDTGKDKIEGWMKWFGATGGMLRKGTRIEGDAIRETMGPLLASGTLAWAPLTAGRPTPTSKLGFTIGTAKFTADKPETPEDNWGSAYITIWKQQPDGTWQVTFDTGRPTNAPTP